MNLLPDNIDFRAWYESPTNGMKIRRAGEFSDEFEQLLFAPRDKPKIVTGFDSMLGKFDLRPHEMTVWAGPNGQGKSMVTTQVSLSLCGQQQKVCIASFEMPPVQTLQRMACIAYGTNDLRPHQAKEFMKWADQNLWLYDHVGSIDPQEMIGVVRYAVMEMEIDHFFIDNLQKCIANEDDYNGQKQFADRLFSIAKDNDTHIHLVHHTRKTRDTPSKSDVKGASSITDLVDNVVLVYRNMHKEDIMSGRVNVKTDEWESVNAEHDVTLDLVKQRGFGHEGCFPLWKTPGSPQFVERFGAQPKLFRMEVFGENLEEVF